MSTSAANISLYDYTQGGQGFTSNSGTASAPILHIPQSIAAVAATATTPAQPAVTYSGTIYMQIQDLNGNPMAAGTVVNAVLDNGSIGGLSVTPVTLGCATDTGGGLFQFSFTSSTTGGSGTVKVTVTSPEGTISTFPIGISVP